MKKLHKMQLAINGSGTGYVKIADTATSTDKAVLLLSFQSDFDQSERDIIVAGIIGAPQRAFFAGLAELEQKLQQAGTLDAMTAVYEEFLEFTGLPKVSADELIHEEAVDGVTRLWVSSFCLKWEKLEWPAGGNPNTKEYLVVGRSHGGPTRALKVDALDPKHAERVFADRIWDDQGIPGKAAREADVQRYGTDIVIDVVAVGDGIKVVNP